MLPPVLYNKNFVRLWLAQILTQTSLNMLYYLLTIKVWESTSSNSAVSILVLSFTLPAIILGPIAGVLVDRWDTKKTIVLTNLIRTAFIPFFFLILKNPFALRPLILLISAVTQFFVPAEGSAIPYLVDKKHLLSANSLFTLTLNITMVVGFVISGPIVRLIGDNGAVALVFFAFVIATILSAQLPQIPGASGGAGVFGVIRELLIALKFTWTNLPIRKAAIAIVVVNGFVLLLSALGPGYVNQVLGMDVVDAGLILVAPGILGVVVGTILLSSRGKNWKEETLVEVGLLVSGLVLTIMAAIHANLVGFLAPLLAGIGMFVLGIFGSFINALATTILHKTTPVGLRGRIYGVVNTLINGISFAPVLIAGELADLAGVSNVILLFGITLLGFGLYRFRKVRNVADLN